MNGTQRSIFSRLVAAAIVLSLVLLAGLWWLAREAVSATVQEAAAAEVDVDIAGLADIYASGGEADLAARIADRLALTPMDGSAAHYLLADGQGRVIAGDLAAWPPLDAATSQSGVIATGKQSRGFARAVQLSPDLRLVVARPVDIEAPVLSSLALVFAGGGAVFVALVALLGLWLRAGWPSASNASIWPFANRMAPQDWSPQVALRPTRLTSWPATVRRRWPASMICWPLTRIPPNSLPMKSARRFPTLITGW